jgi:hypothetical protein
MSDLRKAAQTALEELEHLHTQEGITCAGTIHWLRAALAIPEWTPAPHLGRFSVDRDRALTQPQRNPLTDYQIAEIGIDCLKSSVSWNINFARAIERAHGIGGDV